MVSYTYNGDGIRTGKTVNNIHTEYYQDSAGTILAENKGGTMVRYLFDESGTRIGLYVNGAAYMYDSNVQGDVVAIRNSAGTVVAKYTYDEWGNPISVTDASGNTITSSTHIANLNSFRYRGYYYDAETGFYYLQSRYYDLVVGRFINADALLGANGDMLAYNMFAYCSNNPVNFSDPTGKGFLGALVGVLIGIGASWLADGMLEASTGYGGGHWVAEGLKAFQQGLQALYEWWFNKPKYGPSEPDVPQDIPSGPEKPSNPPVKTPDEKYQEEHHGQLPDSPQCAPSAHNVNIPVMVHPLAFPNLVQRNNRNGLTVMLPIFVWETL